METQQIKTYTFCARRKDGSLKAGIKKAFIMLRNLNISRLQETGHAIWASSGGFYRPIYDFPVSSLSPEEYYKKQRVIISCQEHDDGEAVAIIRLYDPALDRGKINPITLIADTIDNINSLQQKEQNVQYS